MKDKLKRLWCWVWCHDYGGFDKNHIVAPENMKDLSANQTVYLIYLSSLFYCHRCGAVYPQSEKQIAEARERLSEAERQECEVRWETLKLVPKDQI